VGGGSTSPYTHPNLTAGYISKWVGGAKKYYNLDIDYIGIWNERSYDKTYIKVLRKTLDADGFSSVKIVAADSSFGSISKDILNDKELSDAVSVIGAHYPGTHSDADAVKTGKPLWASEDYSTYNDDVGTGCWARILLDNFVNGQMTSTISWNLIASYYDGLPFFRDGLMTAIEPWSGNYTVSGPIWISAHLTQFTAPGFNYLKNDYGSGHLDKGGSYVTLVNPNNKTDFSIIIQTMTHDHSVCIRPPLPKYTVEPQEATFQLKGSFAGVTELECWISNTTAENYFQKCSTPVKIVNGSFTVNINVDSMITLTTRKTGEKGNYPIPPSKPFPLPYKDNFDSYKVNSEASYFADQTGVYEIAVAGDTSHGNVMRQMVPTRPITWCVDAAETISIIGNKDWGARNVTVDAMSEVKGGVFVATQVSAGGCGVARAKGVYFWLMVGSGQWVVTEDLAGIKKLTSGDFSSSTKTWYTLGIISQSSSVSLTINGKMVGEAKLPSSGMKGFVGIGTSGFFAAEFDNFSME
jgi:galactosylceramidase